MSDATILSITWFAVIVHVVIGAMVWRRQGSASLLPLVNLIVALCVLAYWAQRWYGYVVRGVTWYLTDQAMPLVALIVAVLAVLALAGRMSATWPHRVVFGIDAVILLAAAIFFSTFRITRLI